VTPVIIILTSLAGLWALSAVAKIQTSPAPTAGRGAPPLSSVATLAPANQQVRFLGAAIPKPAPILVAQPTEQLHSNLAVAPQFTPPAVQAAALATTNFNKAPAAIQAAAVTAEETGVSPAWQEITNARFGEAPGLYIYFFGPGDPTGSNPIKTGKLLPAYVLDPATGLPDSQHVIYQ